MSIEVRWGAATHVGCVRSVNQDSVLAGPTVFAVADGMGGHAAGEVASGIAVASMARVEAGASGSEVLAAVGAANAAVVAQGAPGSGREGMGTTISGLALTERDGADALLVFNVGDSRTYLLAERGIEQVTSDHSLVAEMVRDGELAADEAASHTSRNVVTRALGIAPSVDIDHWWLVPAAGQVFLLCSDGLSNEVPPAVMEGVLRSAGSPQAAVDALVGIALDNGARDNVSAIAVSVERVTDSIPLDDDTSRRPTSPGRPGPMTEPGPASASDDGRSAPAAADLIAVVPGARAPEAAAVPPAAPAVVTDVPSAAYAPEGSLGG